MKLKKLDRWMTDGEIRESYRHSKYPKKQIEILADLNRMKTEDIKNILGDTEEKGMNMNDKKWNKWTPEEVQQLNELRSAGASAAEIAEALGRAESSVASRIKHDDHPRRKAAAESPKPEVTQSETVRFLNREVAFDIMDFFNSVDRLALADVNIDILTETMTAGYIANGQRYEFTFAKKDARRSTTSDEHTEKVKP